MNKIINLNYLINLSILRNAIYHVKEISTRIKFYMSNMYSKEYKILNYYNDSLILNSIKKGLKYKYLISQPSNTEVVLGRSIKLEDEVYIDNCINDKVLIYRRMGGGGSVILSKGIVVISVGGISNISFHFREQMNSINNVIIEALKYLGIKDLSINGISDITIGDKKILGSSFYSSKNNILYQGSLLYDPDFNIFERYLKHPKKMPEYRKNRKHRDFLTSITKKGYNIDLTELINLLDYFLKNRLPWENL